MQRVLFTTRDCILGMHLWHTANKAPIEQTQVVSIAQRHARLRLPDAGVHTVCYAVHYTA